MSNTAALLTSIIGNGKSNKKAAAEKKLWSIPLYTTLLPFMKTTNAAGVTKIDHAAIGAPLRVARDKDTGEAKFSKTGRIIIRVAPEVNDAVKVMRDLYIATLNQTTADFQKENPEAYAAEDAACVKAGNPVIMVDNVDIDAYNARLEAAKADEAAKLLAAVEAAEAARAEAKAAVSQPEAVLV